MGYVPPPLQPIPIPRPHWTSTGLDMESYKIKMAIYEINKHADSLGEWLFWKYGKGPTITVAWPVGWVILHQNPDPDGSVVSTESADPNDHYRPELTARVGKQNRDWMWKIGPVAADNDANTHGHTTLLIKFSKKNAMWASYFALKWG
jgi:hypothetical protein